MVNRGTVTVDDLGGTRAENELEYLGEDSLKEYDDLVLCHDDLCLYRDGLYHGGPCDGAYGGCGGGKLRLELVGCESRIEPLLFDGDSDVKT